MKHYDGFHLSCFLGFDTTFQLPFPFLGRAGVSLQDVYTPQPKTYLSVCVPGFPNWFQALGPNSSVGSGSLLVVIERQVEYAIKATSKLQRERLRSIEVKKEATKDFDDYVEVRSLHGNGVTVFKQFYSPTCLALFPHGWYNSQYYLD